MRHSRGNFRQLAIILNYRRKWSRRYTASIIKKQWDNRKQWREEQERVRQG